jgi:hypothetical protein
MREKMKLSFIGLLILMLIGIPLISQDVNKSSRRFSSGVAKPEKKSGIIFLSTQKLEEIKDFYLQEVGCQLWVDQESCLIFRYGNLLLGFCRGKEADLGGTITFFYPEKKDVDLMYEMFKEKAKSPPKENPKYRIYHFYTQDPEGRAVEFQCFLHPLDWKY